MEQWHNPLHEACDMSVRSHGRLGSGPLSLASAPPAPLQACAEVLLAALAAPSSALGRAVRTIAASSLSN